MRLDEYQWSHNPRGLHNNLAAVYVDVNRFTGLKMGWAKLVGIDREYIPIIPSLLGQNITPIVRIWRPRFGAGVYTPDMLYALKSYFDHGVRWFEFYNEPNLNIEWPETRPPDYRDVNGVIAPLMQNWIAWAEMVIEMGAYPAFPALAEAVGDPWDVTSWADTMLTYLADNYYDRFRTIANNGLWWATHPYIYNHFYQESTSPRLACPPEAERAYEGGWHFEYPSDPITQADQPGLTAASGPPPYPRGDPIGLTGMGYHLMDRFQKIFGGGVLPVVGTEGGITPVPNGRGGDKTLDTRFPDFTPQSHAEATVALFNWISQQGPPWMFGLALWKENEYFDTPSPVPTTGLLSQTSSPPKSVPALEAIVGPGSKGVVHPGPGPIHGTPDYHFLLIAPGFNTNWFFSEAHDYWLAFRPTVVTGADFIPFIPNTKSLGITVLSTPDLADYMTHQIKDRWPNVWFDLIVAEQSEYVASVLHQRAITGRRFG